METKRKASTTQVSSAVGRAQRRGRGDKGLATAKKGAPAEAQREHAEEHKRRAIERWENEGGSPSKTERSGKRE